MTSPDSALLQGLNAEQRQAVTLGKTHALILAGAGSGKTRILTTRIAWLLHTGQAAPGGILAVTFTNKAAREMRTRLSAMLPLNTRSMWIGTFHGLSNRFLRLHHKLAGLPPAFQILDVQDQRAAIKRLCKAHEVDTERYAPKKLQNFIAHCKEEGLRPEAVVAHDAHARRQVEFYQLYEQQCQREGVADFGELLLRSYEILRDNELLRQHYRQRFSHILIDEFQDTNRLQYTWIKMFAGLPAEGANGTIMAVGDDDQSIYAFRGARVGNMNDFVHEYHVDAPIKLEQNYRSQSHILDCANELIRHNEQRLGKTLRTDAGAGEPVRVYEGESHYAEAEWVVQELQHLHRQEGFARQQMAVLYRSNAQSRVLEAQLFNAGIPYRVYGGLRFFERAEIKHALAYLRLLENPQDDTSFMRVVNFPTRGIGARTLEQLQDAAQASGQALMDSAASLQGQARTRLEAFVALIEVMREQIAGKSLRETIEIMLQASGLRAHYKKDKDGQERLENLDELINAAEAFVSLEGFGQDALALPLDELGARLTQSPVSQGLDPDAPSLDEPLATAADTGETLSPLAAFLTHAALEAGDNQADAGQDAVQLMTVHASKGLEFDAVFITGLEEFLFPHENAMSDADGLEEERRLMYVAITRARKRLYLSHAQTRMLHGQTRYNPASRFLHELPASALKHLSAGKKSFASGTLPFVGGSSGPAAVQAKPSPAQDGGITCGSEVFHAKFGPGIVRSLEGSGDKARAQVDFTRHGTKWLVLSLARLERIE